MVLGPLRPCRVRGDRRFAWRPIQPGDNEGLKPPPPESHTPVGLEAAVPLWRQPAFAEGARDMAGIALGIFAWGLVTGMAMIKSGMGWPLALSMSLLVFAGSAQLVTMPLIASGAPLWVIWGTAACINLRFVIFSAGWRPYLIGLPLAERVRMAYFAADLNYVIFMKRFPEPKALPVQRSYFWGVALINWG